MSEKIMRPNNKYLDINARGAGNGKINLATGELFFNTRWLNYVDWQAGLNCVKVEDATGGAKSINTHCGKGWKLKVSRFLINRENKGTKTSYTYIDENGSYHEFTEKYYYIRKGIKYYVSKNDVKVDENGKLTYILKITTYPKPTLQQVYYDENYNSGNTNNGLHNNFLDQNPLPKVSYETQDVFIESKSTSGFVLETDYTQFKYGNFLETRMQEQIDLEEKVNAYACQLTEYTVVKKMSGETFSNGTSGLEKDSLSKNNFNALIINFNKEGNLLLTKSEAMQYNSLLLQQTVKIENIGKIVNYSSIAYEDKTLVNLQKRLQEWRADCAIKGVDPDDTSGKVNANLEKALNEYLSKEQGEIINAQIKKLIEQSEKNKEDIQKYFKQYLSLKQQLDNLYLQIPVSFITDGNTVMGFNKEGYFVAEIDAYENQTAIIYDGDKIVSIKDTDGNEIAFEYNKKGLLCKIIDENDEITEFEYENDLLSKVITTDGEFTYYFTENAYELLEQVIDCYGNSAYFARNSLKRVAEVNESTRLLSVSDGSAETAYSNGGQFTTITYKGERTTVVKKDHKAATTYIFDNLGNPTTIVEGTYEDPGNLTKAISMEYCDDKQSYSVSENLNEDNLLNDYSSDSLNAVGSTRQRIYRLNTLAEDKTDFVFSCWAKIESANVTDTNQGDRKFELRAVVTYEDGTVSEYKAGFDRANTEWQFLALPVEIKKPLKSGDSLPASLPVMTSGGVDLFIDYSGNTGNIEVDCVSLRSGKWTYSTFDEGGRKLTDEDSESNSVTSYEYDENDRIVKQILTDGKGRTFETSFEYNKQGRLVRSCDYSGLVEETVYDEKGRELKKMVYSLDDPTSKFYTESKRDDKGNITAEIDECGDYDSKKYIYKDNTSVVVKEGKGNKTSFGYKGGNLVSISGNVNGEESTNTMHYTAGLLTKVSNGDTDYEYSYTDYCESVAISIGGKNYSTSKRKFIALDETVTTVYANGNEVSAEINEYDKTRWQRTKFSDLTEKISYSYDELHNVKEITVDINNVRSYNIQYKRDNGKITAEKRSGAYALNKSYSYGADGGLNSVSYKADCGLSSYQYPDSAQELTYIFETDNTPDKRNSRVTLPFGVEQKFAYDGLGRAREVALGENLVKDIYYQKRGDHATNRVSTVWYGVNGIRKDSLKYTCDKAGNITSITENGVVIARYVYDGLNRLICENNSQLNEKIKYEYDHAGNIVCKSVNGQKFKYSYPVSGWRDQLLSYNGEECEYDAIGNPVKYRGRNLSWRGRRLISYGRGAKQATYTYDANSVRTSKTVTDGINTLTSKYIYDGNNLVAEQRDGKWIYYLYGVDGIAGFRYDGETYLYRKNIQGDITHVYRKDEEKLVQVAHYAYDAYGNTKELQENSAISKLNPFRYRGYYYDTETGLYYLITRYYDPETGRFISSDSIEYLDPETLGGLNLYAYCGNNPVMNIDPTGTSALLIGLLILIGAMTAGGAIYGGVSAGIAGGSVGDIFAGIGKGALNGFILGAGISLAIGGFSIGGTTVLGAMMATYGLSITANMLEVAVTQGKKSYYDGDSFWTGANDINNAMFANSGSIIIGAPVLFSVPIYGARTTAKLPTLFNIFMNYRISNDLGFSISFMGAMTETLMAKASKKGLALGYGLTIFQYVKLLQAIFGKPDFKNSNWILY